MSARRGPSRDAPLETVETSTHTVPTDAPEADGTLAWDSTTVVVVQVRAAGAVGTGWTYAPAACARVVDELLAPVVRDADALSVEATYLAMLAAVRNAGRPGLVSLAISAVDCALWDLKARLLDLPLHRLLGAVHDRVPVYGSGGFTTYDETRLERQLSEWVTSGIPRVKIKVGESWGSRTDRDTTRVRRARAVVGDAVELFVDANGAYDAQQAIRWWSSVADTGVSWFEEPVSSDDLPGLRRVRQAVDADVTAGEYGFDLDYFATMLAAGSVDCLQVDVSRCGGITEFRRIAAVAAAHHIEVSAHCAPHLHMAVAAATPNLRHVEWFHDHVRIEQLLLEGAQSADGGAMRPTSEPGNGLAWRAPDAEQFRVA